MHNSLSGVDVMAIEEAQMSSFTERDDKSMPSFYLSDSWIAHVQSICQILVSLRDEDSFSLFAS